MKRVLALLLAVGLIGSMSGCRQQPLPPIYVPPVTPPVVPPPIPVPPPPDPLPTPDPVDPVVDPNVDPNIDPEASTAAPISWEKITRIVSGMTRAMLQSDAVLGRRPAGDRDQRDGSRILRWAAIDDEGVPRWLDVQTETVMVPGEPKNRSLDIVLGRGLWKR